MNGGIGTAVQSLARELVRQGNKVYVAGLYRYRYEQADYEEDQGVKVWRLRFGVNLRVASTSRLYNLLEKSPALLRRHLNGKKAFMSYLHFLQRLIEKENIQVIEIPDWNNFAFFTGFVVRWPAFKAPLIVKSHGSYTYFKQEMNQSLDTLPKTIDLELYRRGDAFAAVSHYTAEQNRKLFSIEKQIKVLYNGIEVPAEHKMERRKNTVIFTGTLIKKKGIFQLLKAWNLVHKAMPDAELIVYGKGKVQAAKDFLDAESAGSVFFKGHVPRTELFDALRSTMLAVFPSYSETFGLMCVEAMSVGCPIIYTKRSCGPEIVQHKENGLLVDPDNIQEIAGAIIELLKDPVQQEKYSENGRRTVIEKFNIVNSAKEHVAFYSEVIQEFQTAKAPA
jgi:glycosyltransferase involved in cell wall biosynthesis